MIVVLYHGAPLATPVFDTDVDVMLSAGYTGQGSCTSTCTCMHQAKHKMLHEWISLNWASRLLLPCHNLVHRS